MHRHVERIAAHLGEPLANTSKADHTQRFTFQLMPHCLRFVSEAEATGPDGTVELGKATRNSEYEQEGVLRRGLGGPEGRKDEGNTPFGGSCPVHVVSTDTMAPNDFQVLPQVHLCSAEGELAA
jgi:hypothetical protein